MAKQQIRPGMKEVNCMNHDPETSKWGQFAPKGGCDELLQIDQTSDRGLCSRCTSRSVSNMNNFNDSFHEEE